MSRELSDYAVSSYEYEDSRSRMIHPNGSQSTAGGPECASSSGSCHLNVREAGWRCYAGVLGVAGKWTWRVRSGVQFAALRRTSVLCSSCWRSRPQHRLQRFAGGELCDCQPRRQTRPLGLFSCVAPAFRWGGSYPWLTRIWAIWGARSRSQSRNAHETNVGDGGEAEKPVLS